VGPLYQQDSLNPTIQQTKILIVEHCKALKNTQPPRWNPTKCFSSCIDRKPAVLCHCTSI